ncbi:MAG: putative DNA binding domain-containing protein [Proteobacteria bacterium]|nr:putative DNA binding domain-containing protein [Pseudomonadota bacterium]
MISYPPQYWHDLVCELAKQQESPWLEFKLNNIAPTTLGRAISALANSAALHNRDNAYMLWGIDDATSDIVGTRFDPDKAKKGNDTLHNHLCTVLEPAPRFEFHTLEVNGHRVVLLEIDRARHQPVSYQGKENIRVGSTNRVLKSVPDLARKLWLSFDQTPFEDGIAQGHLDDDAIRELIDVDGYLRLTKKQGLKQAGAVLASLADEDVIRSNAAGGWDITNLGALLFAKDLSKFPTLSRKALRLIQYQGETKMANIRQDETCQGYAVGFEELIKQIMLLSRIDQSMHNGRLSTVPIFPVKAVRELVANAMIHQDLNIDGTGPTVEIFTNRLIVTSPGDPLLEIDRLVDGSPRSRNSKTAKMMRRMGFCEEVGSGIDKVVRETERRQLPPPEFENPPDSMRAILFAGRDFTDMSKEERLRACYLHACLMWVNHKYLTNASLRKRFGIEDRNKASVSRYIRDAVNAERISPDNKDVGRKSMRYVPYWVRHFR